LSLFSLSLCIEGEPLTNAFNTSQEMKATIKLFRQRMRERESKHNLFAPSALYRNEKKRMYDKVKVKKRGQINSYGCSYIARSVPIVVRMLQKISHVLSSSKYGGAMISLHTVTLEGDKTSKSYQYCLYTQI